MPYFDVILGACPGAERIINTKWHKYFEGSIIYLIKDQVFCLITNRIDRRTETLVSWDEHLLFKESPELTQLFF